MSHVADLGTQQCKFRGWL